jgi:hypothetical protein
VRGTRERGFFAEIAVVVIGVLIALAAGQLLEEWNWGRKVDAGEQQLLQEARINIEYAAEQVAVQPCLDAQLRVLRDRVLASDATLLPAPVHSDALASFVFRTPSRPYSDWIWRALNDDGTVGHMRDDRREILSAVYDSSDKLHELRAQTDLLVGRMSILSHPLPLDPGTRAMLVGALEEQRARSDLQSLVAGQMLGAYRDYGVTFPARAEVMLKHSGTVEFCRKQGLPLQDWIAVMRAEPPVIE